MQAEICELDYKYEMALKHDEKQEDERQFHHRDWVHCITSPERNCEGEQLRYAMEIRKKLREYCMIKCLPSNANSDL